MGGFGDRLFGLLRVAVCTKVYRPDGRQNDVKPKIYISDETFPRERAAIAAALKCTAILPIEEYAGSAAMRAISHKSVITADGGLNTEWLHAALKRLKTDSVLIFSSGSVGYGGAVVLSLMSGAEIVPLYSRLRYKPIRQRRITVGAPIVPGGNNDLSAEWMNSEIKRVDTAMSAIRGAEL